MTLRSTVLTALAVVSLSIGCQAVTGLNQLEVSDEANGDAAGDSGGSGAGAAPGGNTGGGNTDSGGGSGAESSGGNNGVIPEADNCSELSPFPSGTPVAMGTVVVENGNRYECKVASCQGIKPGANTGWGASWDWLGICGESGVCDANVEWTLDGTYSAGQNVQHLGMLYGCHTPEFCNTGDPSYEPGEGTNTFLAWNRQGSCAGSCYNGEVSPGETCRDGGGPTCPARCPLGSFCTVDTDCEEGACDDGTCRPDHCIDEAKSGNESDTDCGGACTPCPDGGNCTQKSDCLSSFCDGTTCAENTHCLADWREDTCRGTCGDTNDGLAVACGRFLECYMNAEPTCSPDTCSFSPDDTCGLNPIEGGNVASLNQATAVYDCMCP